MTQKKPNLVQDMQSEVQKALDLLDSEGADALISNATSSGQEPDEHKVLLNATKSLMGMVWALAKGNGMRETPQVMKMGAQALVTMMTLVHYAYALGVRKGISSQKQGVGE